MERKKSKFLNKVGEILLELAVGVACFFIGLLFIGLFGKDGLQVDPEAVLMIGAFAVVVAIVVGYRISQWIKGRHKERDAEVNTDITEENGQ